MAIASGTITCEAKEHEKVEEILDAKLHRFHTADDRRQTGMVVDQTILLKSNNLLLISLNALS